MSEPPPSVYTVGHGTRTLEALAELLQAAGVCRLVDVRRYPGSRRNPQFAREALDRGLPALSGGTLVYDWRGEALGGRRRPAPVSRHPAWKDASFRAYADYMDTPEFAAALAQLEADARREPLAIMCAETLWWRCHRRLIADALALHGFRVLHLGTGREPELHRLHPELRVDREGRPVYDAGHTLELPLGPDGGPPGETDPGR